jgi:uncharacterized iron-regulated membrane protein
MHSLGYLDVNLQLALWVLGCAATCVIALHGLSIWSERHTRDRTRRIIEASVQKTHDAR